MRNTYLFLIAFLATAPVWGQPPAGTRPASNIPGAEYPLGLLDLVGAVVLWTVVRERNIEGEI
jgi:hypothetical protein